MNLKQIILLLLVFTALPCFGIFMWDISPILYFIYLMACFGVGYFLKDAIDYLG